MRPTFTAEILVVRMSVPLYSEMPLSINIYCGQWSLTGPSLICIAYI